MVLNEAVQLTSGRAVNQQTVGTCLLCCFLFCYGKINLTVAALFIMTIKKNAYQLIFRSTMKLSWIIFSKIYVRAVKRNNSVWFLTN